MCFYAITDFCLGDWKWGSRREKCLRQHRIGESCGAKLIHSEDITMSQTPCKVCCMIAVKERQLARLGTRIER
jgi:hypothetical protein